MKIDSIFSFLAFPSKNEDAQPLIGGAKIPKTGKLYDMLNGIYAKCDTECNIAICFEPEKNGKQNNECRNEIIEFLKDPKIANGRKIAERAQKTTSGRSGMGLLFLMIGKNGKKTKFLLSRFPAEQGITAEQASKSLKVEFVEQVFLKNAKTYKAVLYQGASYDSDFWFGDVVDKQTNHGSKEVADYWIKDFLLSDFKTTSEAGTKRLAMALKNAIKDADSLQIQQEISSVAYLAKNFAGKTTSINDFCDSLHLSKDAKKAVNKHITSIRSTGDKFTFNHSEFVKHLSFKSIELDSGAILTATIESFDVCFEQSPSEDNPDETVFTAQGQIVDEKLRTKK